MFHIVYNPTAGQKKTLKTAEYVKSELNKNGIAFIEHPTQSQGHCTDIVREITSSGEEENIIVIGGDGTFSEAINGVEDFDKVTFGLIPCGTGNDFARKLGIPKKAESALNIILAGKIQNLDYIQLANRRCLNVCGLGMDVDVLVKYASMKHFHGKIKYYLSLFYVLSHFKPHHVRFKIGDVENEQDVFMVAVANGSFIGGGMPISPASDVRDGALDLVVIDNLKKGKILSALLKFLGGKIHLQPYTKVYRSTEAEVEILDAGEGKLQIDGEVRSESKISAKIVKGKLKMFL